MYAYMFMYSRFSHAQCRCVSNQRHQSLQSPFVPAVPSDLNRCFLCVPLRSQSLFPLCSPAMPIAVHYSDFNSCSFCITKPCDAHRHAQAHIHSHMRAGTRRHVQARMHSYARAGIRVNTLTHTCNVFQHLCSNELCGSGCAFWRCLVVLVPSTLRTHMVLVPRCPATRAGRRNAVPTMQGECVQEGLDAWSVEKN